MVTVTSGKGPSHGPFTRSDVVSHGWKVTFVLTESPVPGPTGPGPLTAPHQLHVASKLEALGLLTPAAFPVIALRKATLPGVVGSSSTSIPYKELVSIRLLPMLFPAAPASSRIPFTLLCKLLSSKQVRQGIALAII